MQCAPDSYELYQSIFGLRADAEIGPERSDFDTSLSSLSEAEIEYAAGVKCLSALPRSANRGIPSSTRSDIFLSIDTDLFSRQRSSHFTGTVDLQYCRIFFCTAGRARAQISEILPTL